MSVAAPGGRADRDEDGLGACQSLGQVEGEREAACLDVLGKEAAQPGLEDRDPAIFQRGDLGGVLVDANHVMAEIRKADAGDQSDISGADHRDAHGKSLTIYVLKPRSSCDTMRRIRGSPSPTP